MIRFALGSDKSQSDEAILLSYCPLFRASADLMASILSYLSMANICRFDTAVTNRVTRVIWLSLLRGTNHHSINNHKHSHESIRWLVERGISPEYLETSDRRCVARSINRDTILGLDMSSLRTLSVYQCQIRDEDILSIAHGCPNLTGIILGFCCDLTDVSILALARCCVQLTFIDAVGSSSMVDKGLAAYADAYYSVIDAVNLPEIGNVSDLKRISLRYCKGITDIGISALSRSCPLLSDVGFFDCSNITDIGISALAESCPLLSSIKISSCGNITDIGISVLGKAYPLLSYINLSYSKKISDMAISDLARSCPLIIRVDMAYCQNITAIGVSALGEGCPLLRDIKISDCPNISSDYLSTLHRDHPHIIIVR